jgi:hypothetical protein
MYYVDYETEEPVRFGRYRVRFWDERDGNWWDNAVLATHPSQCRELVDKLCPIEFRTKHEKIGDSLQILHIESVVLPYVLR